jgi:putative protease
VIKIEGRMKTEFYIATVVGAYRKAIDSYCADPENYKFNPGWLEELKKISYREYTTGFFNGNADHTSQNYESSSYVRDWEFAGTVIDYNEKTKEATVQQRNKVVAGAYIEIIGPYRDYIAHMIKEMRDINGNAIMSAPNAMQIFRFDIDAPIKKGDMIRQRKKS